MKLSMVKKIYAVGFILFICCMSLVVMKGMLADSRFSEDNIVYNMENVIEEYIPIKGVFRELYGATNLIISPHHIEGTTKDKDGFLEPMIYETYDIHDAENEISKLKEVCEEAGCEFAYISFPSKSDAENISGYNGWDTNSEEARAEFLAWLIDNDYNLLDVRKAFEADGYHVKDYFYKTDHHWTAEAGLYASRVMANYLKDEFGYNMNVDNLDEDKFTFVTYENLWLGETGRKMTKTWVGVLDSVTEIKPNYDTSFSMKFLDSDEAETGDFMMFIDESGYDGSKDLYEYSAHYSYLGSEAKRVINNNYNKSGPKILLIRDSQSAVIVPFLSLTTSEIVVWNTRSDPEGLLDFIRESDFDIVLLALGDYWSKDIWNFN